MLEQTNFFLVEDMPYHVQHLARRGRQVLDLLMQMAVPESLIVPLLEAHHDEMKIQRGSFLLRSTSGRTEIIITRYQNNC